MIPLVDLKAQYRAIKPEIDAAVQEGAKRELARGRRARPGAKERVERRFEQERVAVARDLDDVLARVGARPREEDRDGAVERLASIRDDVDDDRASRLLERVFGRRAKDGERDAARVGAAHAEDADPPAARRGGDGGDGVVEHRRGAGADGRV